MFRTAVDRTGFIAWSADVSGGVVAAKKGRFVVVVDVIDMSTTLEAVREAGAIGFWGAAPTKMTLPREIRQLTNPYLIGRSAARQAIRCSAQVVIVTEPRTGSEKERRENAAEVIAGLKAEQVQPRLILPSLGAETAKLTDWRKKIVIAVTAAGGTVCDAVWQAGGAWTTATIARTLGMKGTEPSIKGIKRAMRLSAGRPLTFVAASSKAQEDVLAAGYLAQLLEKHQHLDW